MNLGFDFRGALLGEISAYLSLSESDLKHLENHFALLNRWNLKMNLTAIRDPVEIVRRHYCESLFLAAHLPSAVQDLIDVGSGAGFPGIPVAILRSDIRVTLLESNRRKCVFLREATRELPNVRVLALRSSDVAEFFDVLTTRAVSLEVLLKDAWRLARRLEVLTTRSQVPAFGSVAKFEIVRVIPLPWGDERVLVSALPRST